MIFTENIGRNPQIMISKALFSHESDEWGTPSALFQQLDQEFNFTLDACANAENHKCPKYFDKYQDGLQKNWSNEVVFCNPPYSQIGKWCEKCYKEWKYHNVTIVLLIPSRTDTRYFHEYIYNKAELRFIRGRLHFNDSKNSAPFPSMICIFKS